MLKKSEDINAILGDPPMESEYAKKKAQKQMESEDRLLEKLQHNNIAVLKKKRLYAVIECSSSGEDVSVNAVVIQRN